MNQHSHAFEQANNPTLLFHKPFRSIDCWQAFLVLCILMTWVHPASSWHCARMAMGAHDCIVTDYVLSPYDGVQCMLDCCVTAAATPAKVKTIRTHLIPGAAAMQACQMKLQKYKHDMDPSSFVFIPFAVESGGRIHPGACKFLDAIGKKGPVERSAIRAAYRSIQRALMYKQTDQLVRFLQEYHRQRRFTRA